MEWLLDSDPSIRWQVMRDLTGEPAEAVAAERSRVATEGWGARLLALQGEDGQWGRDVVPASSETSGEGLPDIGTRRLLRELHNISLADLAGYLEIDSASLAAWEKGEPDPRDEGVDKYRAALDWMRSSIGTLKPEWISTTFTLLLLRDLGLDPASEQARRAVELVRTTVSGTMAVRTTSMEKSSRASTARPSPWGLTSARTSTASSNDSWVNNLPTAGGTVRRRGVRPGLRSTPRSRFSKACWSTSRPTELPAK